MASVSGWGQLPDGLLHSTLEYMVPIDERIKFSAVCSQWGPVAWEHCREHTSTHQPPLPLVPILDNSERRCSFCNVTHKTLCQSQLWDEEDSEEEDSDEGDDQNEQDSEKEGELEEEYGELDQGDWDEGDDEYGESDQGDWDEGDDEYGESDEEDRDEGDDESEEDRDEGDDESEEEDWEEGDEEEEEDEIIDSEERDAFQQAREETVQRVEGRRKRETVSDFSIQKGVLFMDPDQNTDYVLIVIYV